MSKLVQIFLCHASEDKPKVIEVYRFLKQQGFKPWLDKEDLLPGQRWDQEIPKALKASDFILIFFSQNSVSKRGYVQREFKLALDVLEEIPDGQIFVIPVRLNDCTIPEQFHLLHYCDLFEEGGLAKVVRAIHANLNSDRQGPIATPAIITPFVQPHAVQPKVTLRTQAIETLYVDAVRTMLKRRNFFCSASHKEGQGLKHQYEAVEGNDDNVVIDRVTSLMWQQSGSFNSMEGVEAENYVRQLNNQKFAGFGDWRLPTLEEAMSLMESEQVNYRHIDPVFDEKQSTIWTGDNIDLIDGGKWYAAFSSGFCFFSRCEGSNHFVRAVRAYVQADKDAIGTPHGPTATTSSKLYSAEKTILASDADSSRETIDSVPPLRARPLNSFSADAVRAMLNEKNLFDSSQHKEGKGFKHQYKTVTQNGEKLVIDYTTGLIWQQSGSHDYMAFAKAQNYVDNLNRSQFAGFSDWRLPTLEEAMSLMEPEMKSNGLYIDPVFEKEQRWIRTADQSNMPGRAWVVDFSHGGCDDYSLGNAFYVRVVRSGQS